MLARVGPKSSNKVRTILNAPTRGSTYLIFALQNWRAVLILIRGVRPAVQTCRARAVER